MSSLEYSWERGSRLRLFQSRFLASLASEHAERDDALAAVGSPQRHRDSSDSIPSYRSP